MSSDPRIAARRAGRRKWFWRANLVLVPPITLEWIPPRIAFGYLVAISVWALSEGAEGAEQGAESRFPEDDDESTA